MKPAIFERKGSPVENKLTNLLARKPFVLLDGAMGTMLQKEGLKPGERPELFVLQYPEKVAAVHRQYLESGSSILYTCTFGASRRKLAKSGTDPETVIRAAFAAAKQAADSFAGERPLIALDIGPIGELLYPAGMMRFEEAYELFKEQLLAGEALGADLVVFETMTDLAEMRAGILAARECTNLPILATMTFEAGGRTFTGCSAGAMARTLEGLGVDALGVNCSLGPDALLPIAREIAASSSLPLVVKANAGLPDPRDGSYALSPEDFARQMAAFAECGMRFAGGCCGTTPAHIAALREALAPLSPAPQRKPAPAFCSASRVVPADGVRIIGERLNPTGKKQFQQALLDGDIDYILDQGLEQADAGAELLDLNVGMPGVDEPALMRQAAEELQSVLSLPLQIDSSDPAAIEAGLRAFHGVGIVNSVNGDRETLDAVLPLVKKYGAFVIGLTLDSSGIPKTAEERLAIARRILDAALSYGIPREKVLIDCLTLTVSAQQPQAAETLRAVRMVREELGLQTVLGVSNISFGLPNRELLNAAFLTAALESGLNFPILNPNVSAMTDAVAAYRVLHGLDAGAADYIGRFGGQGARPAPAKAASGSRSLPEAVKAGLKEEARAITERLLETEDPFSIIDGMLIPALDEVGDGFEAGALFLPQLLNAAAASQEAFAAIHSKIAASGGAPAYRGKVLLATVKGDVHDIGKNIVKVLLENYGFQVLDLGRDVPPEKIVETAVREDVRLVGLSALMTTTLKSMAETIRQLRASGHDCRIMVGGAVLTEQFAREMGADFYAKDAKRSADIAKEVFGEETR